MRVVAIILALAAGASGCPCSSNENEQQCTCVGACGWTRAPTSYQAAATCASAPLKRVAALTRSCDRRLTAEETPALTAEEQEHRRPPAPKRPFGKRRAPPRLYQEPPSPSPEAVRLVVST